MSLEVRFNMKCWLIPFFSFILSLVFIGISYAQAAGDMPTVINDKTAISIGFMLLIVGGVTASLRKTGKYDAHLCDNHIHRSTEELSNVFVPKTEYYLAHQSMEEKIDEIRTDGKETKADMKKAEANIGKMQSDIAVLLARSKKE